MMKRENVIVLLYWLTWLTIPGWVAHQFGDNILIWFGLSLLWPATLLFGTLILTAGPRH